MNFNSDLSITICDVVALVTTAKINIPVLCTCICILQFTQDHDNYIILQCNSKCITSIKLKVPTNLLLSGPSCTNTILWSDVLGEGANIMARI